VDFVSASPRELMYVWGRGYLMKPTGVGLGWWMLFWALVVIARVRARAVRSFETGEGVSRIMEVAGTLGIGTEDSMVTEIESVGVAGNSGAHKRGREWVVVEEGGAIGRF